MRKQTKLVAVLSAAALLAIGASMTSFAATGWTEENGTWVYYDKNGDMVTDSWAKSGNSWFFLGGDGEMVVDELVEDGDYYYYVDENGSMVTNRWVAIDNEDAGNDNEPQQFWYYFQANGKAMQGPQDNKVSLKTINGKKYAFNNDGKMAYGWIKTEDVSIINDDDDAWKYGNYYFGDENDGAMTVGWKMIDITDPDTSSQHFVAPAFEEDEDQSRWFYFKTNGQKTKGTSDELKESTINGKKYGFDEYGRMVAEWSTASESTATDGSAAKTWKYFSDVESGARVTKGWFKVVAPEALNSSDFNDDSAGWYYADNNGHIYANEMKTINGKKYAFNAKGKMVTGLKFIQTDGNDIGDILGDDNDTWPFDTDENFAKNAGYLTGNEYSCYYFGSGDDGAMKTGATSIEIDGEKFNFLFGKSGGKKGVGFVGEDNKKLYNAGRLITAGKDEKYQVVVGIVDEKEKYAGYQKLADANVLSEYVAGATKITNWSESDPKVQKLIAELTDVSSFKELQTRTGMTSATADKYSEIVIYQQGGKLGLSEAFKVVNTSGKISEKNSKNKDGDDTYYKLYDDRIVATYVEN